VQFAQLAMHQRVNEIAFFSIIVVVKWKIWINRWTKQILKRICFSDLMNP
jgi:hypothetical protein